MASSDDSVEAAARFAGRMTMFADRSWDHRMPSITHYRERFRELHGREAPPLMTADFCFCWPDEREAAELAHRYMGTYLGSLLEHYEVMGDHFAVTEGYDAYAKAAEVLRRVGESGFLQMFMKATSWGTPDQILANLEARRELIGPFEYTTAFRYGGIPFERRRGLDAALRRRGPPRRPLLGLTTALAAVARSRQAPTTDDREEASRA